MLILSDSPTVTLHDGVSISTWSPITSIPVKAPFEYIYTNIVLSGGGPRTVVVGGNSICVLVLIQGEHECPSNSILLSVELIRWDVLHLPNNRSGRNIATL